MRQEYSKQPIIVTGLSGAGLSSVLKTLEDLGLEVFDNFPLKFVKPLIKETAENDIVALGIDTRTRNFKAQTVIDTAQSINAKIIFITCDDPVLYNRFTETRRIHPLALEGTISEGIEKERKILAPIQAGADLTIDTTHLSVHDLRHILEGHFRKSNDEHLTITLMSFGFKNGLPREADIVMDVRFLKNPHWVPALKPKTGQDPEIADYINKDPAFSEFINNFETLMSPLFSRYKDGGKSYLTIAIGCTGGRHRSVYTVEHLQNWLSALGHKTRIAHRDLLV